VREPLEVQAALDALPYVDTRVVTELSTILADAQSLLDGASVRSFLLANRKFHLTLARATGNAVLYQMLSAISDRIRLICETVIHRHSPRAKEILEENFRILDALKQRDATAVETAVRAHIQRAGEHASTFFGQELSRLYLGEGEHG
jgi:DNA-binding GntR family transcriptional regulator